MLEATTGALPALPTISGSVAQLEEQPVVCGKAEGANPFGSANFKSHRGAHSQGLRRRIPPSRSAASERDISARSVAATHPAWDRDHAGALRFAKRTVHALGLHLVRLGEPTPAALSNFTMLPWPNTSGIRLLSGLHVGGNPAGSASSLVAGCKLQVEQRDARRWQLETFNFQPVTQSLARWCQSSTAVC